MFKTFSLQRKKGVSLKNCLKLYNNYESIERSLIILNGQIYHFYDRMHSSSKTGEPGNSDKTLTKDPD